MSYKVILPTGAQRSFSSPLDAVTYAVTSTGNMHPHHAYLQSLKNTVQAGGTVTIDGILVLKESSQTNQTQSPTKVDPGVVFLVIGLFLMAALII